MCSNFFIWIKWYISSSGFCVLYNFNRKYTCKFLRDNWPIHIPIQGKRETFNTDSSKKNKVYISIQKFVGTVAFFYHYSFHGPEIKFVDNLTSNGLLQQWKKRVSL